MQTINWYPGHMKKTRELIAENLKLVDAVLEVLDARIPMSSRNPIIKDLIGTKPAIALLNKSDLADQGANDRWIARLQQEGGYALPMNAKSGQGIKALRNLLIRLREAKNQGQLRQKPFRLMVVGVPNTGKSSLINRMTGKKSTQTGDRPGVTKGKQWLNLQDNIQLLDTPGILWPKFEDPQVGQNLAFCGSIRDEIMDMPSLALELTNLLQQTYAPLLCNRYKLEQCCETPLETLDAIAKKRGCLLPGGKIDYERIANILVDEFRSGTIGHITLEQAETPQA